MSCIVVANQSIKRASVMLLLLLLLLLSASDVSSIMMDLIGIFKAFHSGFQEFNQIVNVIAAHQRIARIFSGRSLSFGLGFKVFFLHMDLPLFR